VRVDEKVAVLYRRFAETEARGVSAIYYGWAIGVAGDREVLDLIARLHGIKRQPNLVFAAARHLGAPEGPYAPFRLWLVSHWADVSDVVESRSTQTNEAARCSVLLPILSRVDGDVALIEAGASAGLTLYPDRYSYRYDAAGTIVELDPPDGPSEVVIPCTIDEASVPARVPQVAWRAGIDLNPIDARDPNELNWLESLVWPEHDARRARLRSAAIIAASDPPHLVKGDIIDEVPHLIGAAPGGTRIIVFHSAVLNYLPQARREDFADLMSSFPEVMWISNEGAGVIPSVTEQVDLEVGGRTIIAVDGRPVALAGPHGLSYQAL
jgi:hypothetical protein